MTFSTNLYEASKNSELEVISVPNIALLKSLGLRSGSKVELKTRYSLGGPVLLSVEGAYSVAIGKDIATQIAVKEIAAS
ncbi:MAG: ferrous iron transport protein A [Spirochaetes bacterium]|nr:ferrous iron transport protein A [Spirochaetota bacterium]